MSEDPLRPMLNNPKSFCKYCISHASAVLRFKDLVHQVKNNCKFTVSLQVTVSLVHNLSEKTFYAEKWDHAVQDQFSGLTE